jgi:hypothetical protein
MSEAGDTRLEAIEEQEDDDELQLPEDDLEHYTGQWVAMRDGKVVAHEPDAESLRANPAVLSSDDVFPVGDPPSGFYTIEA